MNKTDAIIGFLATSPSLTPKDIATKVGCTPAMVRYVKRSHTIKVPQVVPQESIVGVIGDTHCPHEQDGYFEFVSDTFARHGVNKVVHIGDFIDHHAASRFQNEFEAPSILAEIEQTKQAVKRWTTAFPEVKWTLGNHDRIPTRQAREIGLSPQFVRSLHEIYDIPETWDAQMSHEIDGVIFEHGVGSAGVYGCRNAALRYRCSYVCGHSHANGSVFYLAGPRDTLFAMNVGCGINPSSFVNNYAADMKSKPTLGCGIVKNGKEAYFVPMI